MSGTALAWALPLAITGAKKAVLLALAAQADDDGRAAVRQAELATFAGVTDRAVRAAVTELEAAALLSNIRSDGRAYLLHIGQPAPERASAFRPKAERGSGQPERASGQAERGSGSDETPSAPLPAPPFPPIPPLATPPFTPPPEPPRRVRACDVPGDLFGAPPPAVPAVIAPAPAAAPGLRQKRTKTRTQCPADWWPDQAGLDFAARHAVSPQQEVPRFRDYHLSRGNPMADWAAAWRTWCMNQRRWREERPAPRQDAGDRVRRGMEVILGMPSAHDPPPFDPARDIDLPPGDWSNG